MCNFVWFAFHKGGKLGDSRQLTRRDGIHRAHGRRFGRRISPLCTLWQGHASF